MVSRPPTSVARTDILLITPPLLQPNAPYPAMPFLAGELRRSGYRVSQWDASLDLFLALFTGSGPARLVERMLRLPPAGRRQRAVRHVLEHRAAFVEALPRCVSFLQGRAPRFAERVLARDELPEGPRFAQFDQVARLVARHGVPAVPGGDPDAEAHARHLATLCIDEFADAVSEGLDPDFRLGRYAERLAVRLPDYAPLRSRLDTVRPGPVLQCLAAQVRRHVRPGSPRIVGLTVPFPGNLLPALFIARAIRRLTPDTHIVLGGGYVGTELRGLRAPALFDDVDSVVLDDGREPMLAIADRVLRGRRTPWIRTFRREAGRVAYHPGPQARPRSRPPAFPDYTGLRLRHYVSMIEFPNPVTRLWSDGFWNKLQLAHGCYWQRCAFCDTALDYIRRFAPHSAEWVLDCMEHMMQATGSDGFHFVDEAMPPALTAQVARGILRRGLRVRWWGNVRFEPAFTPELAVLLRRSGCIAVTGGMETAHDPTLRAMNKGVEMAHAEVAARNLAGAGIRVHAYLMYGFPGQRRSDVLAGLERIRRLFRAGALHSVFWHQFALTVHSPIAADPGRFGLRVHPAYGDFARNEVDFNGGPRGLDELGRGLRTAAYNYMLGLGLDLPVRAWFPRFHRTATAHGRTRPQKRRRPG